MATKKTNDAVQEPKDPSPDRAPTPSTDAKAAPKAETPVVQTPPLPIPEGVVKNTDAEKPAKTAPKPDIQKEFVPGALDPANPPDQPATRLVEVRVKDDYRWETIQSAGASWGKVPQRINSNDPRLVELRANPFVEVTEVTEE